MQKPLTALILGSLLVLSSAAQERTETTVPKLDGRAQTVSTGRGMNQTLNDWIGAISQVATVGALFVAIFMARTTVRKYTEDRDSQRKKDDAQKAKELAETRQNTKMLNALFWLQLRKMFSEHDEVHLKLRGGKWSASKPAPLTDEEQEWAKLEAYMGLLEHTKRLRSDDLIDSETLRSIYAYRIQNIICNPEIVREKLVKRFRGWKDFIELVGELNFQSLMVRTATQWLNSEQGKEWLATDEGKIWLASGGRVT